MEWTTYCFECADADARRDFMAHLEATEPVEFPDESAESTHQEITDTEGKRLEAEYAWLEDHHYLYVTALAPVPGLVESTAEFWERAVAADFDTKRQACVEATLYESHDGEASEVDTYEGLEEAGGADILWRLAIQRQFRFRAYAASPPTTIPTEAMAGAFDFLPIDRNQSLFMEIEAATGIHRRPSGMEFLREDPARQRAEREEQAE